MKLVFLVYVNNGYMMELCEGYYEVGVQNIFIYRFVYLIMVYFDLIVWEKVFIILGEVKFFCGK